MGNMGLSLESFAREGLPDRVAETLKAWQMNPSRGALGQQVHGDKVRHIVAGDVLPLMIPGTDALITADTGVVLITFGADCPNVFLVDVKTKAIGMAHSGRLGTLAGIVPKTVRSLQERLGADPASMIACISPSIGPCCYPTDLWGMLESQLRASGVRHIENERICTRCHTNRFFSYRASKDSSRMMGALTRI